MLSRTPSLTDKTLSQLQTSGNNGGIVFPVNDHQDLILYEIRDESGTLSSLTYIFSTENEIKYERTFRVQKHDLKAQKFFDNFLKQVCASTDNAQLSRFLIWENLHAIPDLIIDSKVFTEGVENFSYFTGTHKRALIVLGFTIPSWEATRVYLRILGFQNPLVDHTGDAVNGYMNHMILYGLIRLLNKNSDKYYPCEIAFLFSSLSVVMAETGNHNLFGTADLKDIPAGIIGASFGWAFMKCVSRHLASYNLQKELDELN